MKTSKLFILLLFLIALLFPTSALAQEEEPGITLTLTRVLGYGGLGGDIQGTFIMRVSGPDDLVEVHFFIDDLLVGTVKGRPFNLQFHTDSFAPDVHTFHAIGVMSNGTELHSNAFSRTFLSGEGAAKGTITLVGTIMAVVVVFTVIGVVAPMLLGKKGKQRPIGEYSAAGGAVCPRCNLPFSRSVLGPNLVVGKLERCPHCNKWAIVRRATSDELRAAEERLRADRQEGVAAIQQDEEESLRRALDESRFDD